MVQYRSMVYGLELNARPLMTMGLYLNYFLNPWLPHWFLYTLAAMLDCRENPTSKTDSRII